MEIFLLVFLGHGYPKLQITVLFCSKGTSPCLLSNLTQCLLLKTASKPVSQLGSATRGQCGLQELTIDHIKIARNVYYVKPKDQKGKTVEQYPFNSCNTTDPPPQVPRLMKL